MVDLSIVFLVEHNIMNNIYNGVSLACVRRM